MTRDEKEKIKELRLKGKGYKAIANFLGLTRDSVRGFCKRNSLSGDSCVVALNVEEKVKRNVLCSYFENPLKQKSTGRMRRFCCDDCRRKWWKEHDGERKKNKIRFMKSSKGDHEEIKRSNYNYKGTWANKIYLKCL